jgi:diadenosine tetraphosphatase ApaH/serine/threonine PP2A family protein phosphatase
LTFQELGLKQSQEHRHQSQELWLKQSEEHHHQSQELGLKQSEERHNHHHHHHSLSLSQLLFQILLFTDNRFSHNPTQRLQTQHKTKVGIAETTHFL